MLAGPTSCSTLLCLLIGLFASSHGEKRILLKDNTNAAQDIHNLQTEVLSLQNTTATLLQLVSKVTKENADLKQQVKSVYTRWGRTSCPGNGPNLVYSGYTAGSHYTDTGGAANYICVTQAPQWGHYEDSVASGARVYGAEYETSDIRSNGGDHFFGRHLYQEDVPCAVCQIPRAVNMMIPSRQDCYPGWSREYHGYLMAGKHSHPSATEYICVDGNPEVEAGGHPNENGKLLYFVEGRCGSLKCPPYIQGRELTCVVCSR